MTLQPITAPALDDPRLVHGFFTRQGGVSTGPYGTLNGGIGSRDARDNVLENRRRMAETLGVTADRLVLPHLVHSPDAQAIAAPFTEADRPRCDGLATRTPGLALAVTGADCGIVLLADAAAGVVGACHAGWKGAVFGVLESTVAAMIGLGATTAGIAAVLGPTIACESYEVGPEFRARVVERDAGDEVFFVRAQRAGSFHFDLPGFICHRLRGTGIGRVVDLALDTYADEARFFSYRRATHRGEPDYGRLVGAIALRG